MLRKIVFLIVLRFFSVEPLQSDVINVRPQLKIIGGHVVKNRSDFSYQVSLRFKGSHFCGGAIVDRTFILTAAHCCFDNDGNPLRTKNLKVVAGDLNIKSFSPNNAVKSVTKVYSHPKYNNERIENDIALWEVSSPFIWTEFIQPVKIVDEIIKLGTPCNVSGWGVTSYDSEQISNYLQYVQVPIISNSSCRRIYPETEFLKVICAGRKGRDSCQGDSGGALVCNGSLSGIVSYGLKCGVYPGVYTDVYAYRSWIGKKIRMSSGTSTKKKFAFFYSLIITLIVETIRYIIFGYEV